MLNDLIEQFNGVTEKMASWVGENYRNKRPKKNNKEKIIYPEFLSGLLPYDSFDKASSLFINKNSIGFILETTPLLGSSEEVENILSSIITDIIPENVDIQFLLFASPKIEPIFTLFEHARASNQTIEWLAKRRTEYLKKGASESLSQAGEVLLRNFRTFIVVSQKGKNEEKKEVLLETRANMQSSLQSVNIMSSVVNAKGFVQVFCDIITPSQSPSPHDLSWNPLDDLSSQITNPEWSIQIFPDYLKFSAINEEIQAHCLSVQKYPEYPTQWRMADNLGQLFNDALQIPCPFLVSFSLRKVNKTKASAEADLRKTNTESNANSPLAKFVPSIVEQYHDWKLMSERLAEGDAQVKTFYQIIFFAKPEKAKYCERRVRDLYNANGWKLRKESYLQMQSWLAAMPMVMSEGLFNDLKFAKRIKTMTAFNAINIAPLQGEWKGTKTPGILIPGRRGQIAFWSPFDNEGGNYNVAIAAAPEKGKSVLVQEMIMSILGENGQVQVIDQGHSQQKNCKYLKGQFIELTQHKPLCLNPFSTITDLDESIVMLKAMVAGMARPIRGVSEEEMSYIEQAIKGAYEREGQEASIGRVSQWLEEQSSDMCKNLAHLLYSYTAKGSYAKFFEGKCSIDFDNPFIVLELQDLKSKSELRKIVLQLLIYHLRVQSFPPNVSIN